jgi:pimeloyl-ACP methyl ester carboxylesterase
VLLGPGRAGSRVRLLATEILPAVDHVKNVSKNGRLVLLHRGGLVRVIDDVVTVERRAGLASLQTACAEQLRNRCSPRYDRAPRTRSSWPRRLTRRNPGLSAFPESWEVFRVRVSRAIEKGGSMRPNWGQIVVGLFLALSLTVYTRTASGAVATLIAQGTMHGTFDAGADYSTGPISSDLTNYVYRADYTQGSGPARRNQLLVFFPGTGGSPSGYTQFAQEAAFQGYDVISMDWPGSQNANDPICGCYSQCYFHYNQLRVRSYSHAGLPTIAPRESINMRIKAIINYVGSPFLQYLDANNAYGGINWPKIAIAGHSQGSDFGTHIAEQTLVARVILFSGDESKLFANVDRNCGGDGTSGTSPNYNYHYYGDGHTGCGTTYSYGNSNNLGACVQQTTVSPGYLNSSGPTPASAFYALDGIGVDLVAPWQAVELNWNTLQGTNNTNWWPIKDVNGNWNWPSAGTRALDLDHVCGGNHAESVTDSAPCTPSDALIRGAAWDYMLTNTN